MEKYEEIKTDVLIIGSEAGGARAAIEAAKQGRDVLMVSKGVQSKSGVTMLAVYSCNAALGHADPRDNPEVHFRDTVIGGRFLNNQKLVEIFTKEAIDRVLEMEQYGIRWTKRDGKFDQGMVPGHTYPRSLHVEWATGIHFSRVLRTEAKKYPKVKTLNLVFVTGLIQSEGKIAGAFAINMVVGTFMVIRAKATVLATGGGMYLYDVNSATYESTGDGYAYAYRAGAKLMDMEYPQFYPTCMAYPLSIRGLPGATTVRYFLNAKLYNTEGERFMRRYDPARMEMTTRDVLARSIFKEMKAGRGSPHGGVWLDCSFLPRNIILSQVDRVMGGKWKWSGTDIQEYGLDVTKMAIEVAPAMHYFMGGIRVDEQGATGVEGLFAGGEAIVGIDGANRLAGNALSACLVTGCRAGRYAGEHAAGGRLPEVGPRLVEAEQRRVFGFLDETEGENPIRLRRDLQRLMYSQVGIVRRKDELLDAIKTIGEMQKKKLKVTTKTRRYNGEWIESLAVSNMLDVGEMIARSALMRTESRGAHYREDYPESNDREWLKNVFVEKKEGEMASGSVPVVITKLRPEEVSDELKKDN